MKRLVAIAVVMLLGTSIAPGGQAHPDGASLVAQGSDDADASWRALVAQGLDHDLHGRHDAADAVWAALEARDAADPEPWVRRIDTTYWRFYYDTGVSLDEQRIRDCLDRAKALATKRLDTVPDDQRAQWLLGETLMSEARFEGMRGNYMQAGTVGERGRKQLERLLETNPDHPDARYMLGLYYYFSGLMPSFVQAMSWLWFIPKGDSAVGVQMLEEVRQSDSLHADGAAMVLASIHTYHAPLDLEAAHDVVTALRRDYPDNAIIHFEQLEVLLKLRRHDELLAEALALEQRTGESPGIAGRAVMAKLWRARSALRNGHPDEGRAIALGFDENDPAVPPWGAPWVWIVRGQAHDLGGDRAAATAAYERALSLSSDDFDGRRPKRIATAGLERPFDPSVELDGPVIGAD